MVTADIRATALGILRHEGRILVERYEDEGGFFRPIGGGIEFGESSAEAVVREFDEELDRTVTPDGFSGVVENFFTFRGEVCHELTFVHEVEFVDPSAYDVARFTVHESDGSVREATWEPTRTLLDGGATLYPAGVDRLLRGESTHVVSPPE